MNTKPVPEPTLRRLPAYYHYLKAALQRGAALVSCSRIGADLGFDPSQIRKDFDTTGLMGKPKVGYSVPALVDAIEKVLAWDRPNNAFLAGADGLGRALLTSDFKQFGMHIAGIFDTGQDSIGERVHGYEVLPLGYLPDLARTMGVRVGIVTLPATSAQTAAALMVQGGIQAIWNFAPIKLEVPSDIIVQNEDLYYSLAALSYKLARRGDNSMSRGGETNAAGR